jgi:hypothetical protein
MSRDALLEELDNPGREEPPETLERRRERFLRYVKVDAAGCWIWTGSRMKSGYGRFKVRSYETRFAHRVAYEIWVGPIPSDHQLDHLCSVKPCVNPTHLEPVTHGENVRRWAATITACPRGHEYTPENTMRTPRRECRTCRREGEAVRRASPEARAAARERSQAWRDARRAEAAFASAGYSEMDPLTQRYMDGDR